MIKDSDSDELREVYRVHQETCENLRSLKKKYGVAKNAHDIDTLRKIAETKTGKRLKKTMSVQRDRGPDETVQSDFYFFMGLMVKKAALIGKISTLNGKKLRRKNGKYLYIRDYKKIMFLEVPKDAWTCCVCGRKTRLWSHHVVPRRLTKEKAELGNLRMRICGRCHKAIHPENELIHHLRAFIETLEAWFGEDSLKANIDNFGLVKRLSEKGFNDDAKN